MSKLNDIAAEKDEQLKQKEEEMSELNNLVTYSAQVVSNLNDLVTEKNEQLSQTRKKLSQQNHLMVEKDEELQQKNEEASKLKTQVFKKKGQLESTTKVGKMKPRWKDWEMKKKEFLLNEKVKSANARAEKAPAWGGSRQYQPNHLGKASIQGGSHYPGRQIQR